LLHTWRYFSDCRGVKLQSVPALDGDGVAEGSTMVGIERCT
jgi:hypothetical protein